MRVQQGASLVNLLVSLALASYLLLLIAHVLQQSLAKQNFYQAHLLLQQEGNLILQLLSEEVRLAGFFAYSFTSVLPADECGDSRLWAFDVSHKLDTQANHQRSVLQVPLQEECLSIRARENSDMLFVRRLSVVEQGLDFSFEKAWYLLQKDEGHDEFVFLESWPSELLRDGDTLWKLESKLFYIRDYSVQGDNIPSLVVAKPVARGFEHQVLVENVETMQLQWQVKIDEDNFSIENTPGAEQLSKAVLLRVYVLLRSDSIEPTQRELVLASPYAMSDQGSYYQAFSSSVYLRHQGN